jgi:hypothetical protein
MSILEDFKKLANEQRKSAQVLLESVEISTDPKKQIATVVGLVTANMYEALADISEYLKGAERLDDILNTRKQIAEQNHALRLAAARGDWDEYDRITLNFQRDANDAAGVRENVTGRSSTGGNAA